MDKISGNVMHIGLRVKDYNASYKFYHDILGFEEMFTLYMKDQNETKIQAGEEPIPLTKEEEEQVWLTYLRIKNGQYMELFPVPKEEVSQYYGKQSFFHFSLQVDDLMQAVEKLRKHGVTIYTLHFDIITNTPAPEKFVPLPGRCGSLIAWIKDPDGNMIELMQLTDNSLQKKYDRED